MGSNHLEDSAIVSGITRRQRRETSTRLLVSAEQTAGQFCVFEQESAPNAGVGRHISPALKTSR